MIINLSELFFLFVYIFLLLIFVEVFHFLINIELNLILYLLISKYKRFFIIVLLLLFENLIFNYSKIKLYFNSQKNTYFFEKYKLLHYLNFNLRIKDIRKIIFLKDKKKYDKFNNFDFNMEVWFMIVLLLLFDHFFLSFRFDTIDIIYNSIDRYSIEFIDENLIFNYSEIEPDLNSQKNTSFFEKYKSPILGMTFFSISVGIYLYNFGFHLPVVFYTVLSSWFSTDSTDSTDIISSDITDSISNSVTEFIFTGLSSGFKDSLSDVFMLAEPAYILGDVLPTYVGVIALFTASANITPYDFFADYIQSYYTQTPDFWWQDKVIVKNVLDYHIKEYLTKVDLDNHILIELCRQNNFVRIDKLPPCFDLNSAIFTIPTYVKSYFIEYYSELFTALCTSDINVLEVLYYLLCTNSLIQDSLSCVLETLFGSGTEFCSVLVNASGDGYMCICLDICGYDVFPSYVISIKKLRYLMFLLDNDIFRSYEYRGLYSPTTSIYSFYLGPFNAKSDYFLDCFFHRYTEEARKKAVFDLIIQSFFYLLEEKTLLNQLWVFINENPSLLDRDLIMIKSGDSSDHYVDAAKRAAEEQGVLWGEAVVTEPRIFLRHFDFFDNDRYRVLVKDILILKTVGVNGIPYIMYGAEDLDYATFVEHYFNKD